MRLRSIDITTDTFAMLWAARRANEHAEEDIIRRLLDEVVAKRVEPEPAKVAASPIAAQTGGLPRSKKWTDLLVWTLNRLGGQAHLSEIYRVSREGRRALGYTTTLRHDDAARECLESHSSESKKWREGKEDLFCMPQGKGAGIWALRR